MDPLVTLVISRGWNLLFQGGKSSLFLLQKWGFSPQNCTHACWLLWLRPEKWDYLTPPLWGISLTQQEPRTCRIWSNWTTTSSQKPQTQFLGVWRLERSYSWSHCGHNLAEGNGATAGFQLKKPSLKNDISIFRYFPLMFANTSIPQKSQETIICQAEHTGAISCCALRW